MESPQPTRQRPPLFARGLWLLVACSLATPALAVDKIWVGGSGGGGGVNWGTAANWNPNGVPGAADAAIFDASSAINCTINLDVSVAELRINGFAGTVTQNNSRTVTVGATGFSAATGTFVCSNAAITVSGPFTVSGGTFTGGTGDLTVTGLLTLSGGTFTAPIGVFSVAANWNRTAGTFAPGTGTVTFTSAGTQTLNGGGAGGNFNNASHTGAGTLQVVTNALAVGGTLANSAGVMDANGIAVTVTGLATASGGTYQASTAAQTFNGGLTVSGGTFTGSTGTVAVNGVMTLSAGTLTAPTGTFTVSGNWARTAGTFTPGTGTVTFNGTGTQTLNSGGAGGNFNSVSHTGTGTLQVLTNALAVDGTLGNSNGTINANALAVTVTGLATLSGGIYTASTATQTFNGGLVISGGTLTGSTGAVAVNGALTFSSGTLTAPTGSFTVSGNWSRTSGTFTPGTGTVTFNGAGTQTLDSGGAGGNFNIVSHSGTGTLQAVNNAVTVAGTVANSNGTFDANGLAVTVTGLVTASGGTYLASTGTQTLNGGLTVGGGTFTGSTGTVAVTGTVTLSSGTLNAPTGTFTVTGNWTRTGGTFNPGAGTVTFTGGALQALNSGGAGGAFNNISHTGAATLQVTTNALTVGGTLANSAGTFSANALAVTVTGLTTLSGGTYLASTATQTLTGGLTISGGTLTGSTGAVAVGGALTLSSGTLTAPTGTFTVSGNWSRSGGTFTPGTGTVTFDGAGTQTLDSGGAGGSFNGVSHSGAGTLQVVTNTLTVTSTLTNSNGIFDANGIGVSVTGVTTVSGGTYQASTGTQTFSGGLTVSGGTFTGSTGTVTVAVAVTITSGTLTAPAAAGALNVSGNFAHTAGTFAPNLGTVTFDGAGISTISGTTTFNEFRCVTPGKQINFTAATTQTIAGALTLTGSAASQVRLRSTASPTRWSIDVTGGPQNVLYVDVMDSNALTNIVTVNLGTNSGNNNFVPGVEGWAFQNGRFWVGGTGVWSDTARWSGASGGAGGAPVPDATQPVTFDASSGAGTCTIDVAANALGITFTAATGMTVVQGASPIAVASVGWDQAGGTFSGGSGSISIGGNLNLTGGTFTATSGTLTITGDLTNSATFTHNGGTTVIDGAASVLGTSTTTFNHLTINGTRSLTAPAGTMNVNGDFTITGSFTHNGGTVGFVRAAATQTLAAGGTTFQNLNQSGAATLVMAGGATVNGTLTVAATLDVGAQTLTVAETGSFAGVGTLSVGAGGSLVIGPASFSSPTTASFAATSSATYSRAGAQTVRAVAYGSLTLSGSGTKTFATGTATVNGTLALAGTALASLVGASNIDLVGAGPHSVPAGTGIELVASGGSAPVFQFIPGGALTVNGTFRATAIGATKPTVTGSASGNTDLRLLGATVSVTGMAFSNGPLDGLLIGKNGGTDSTVSEFRGVDFSGMFEDGRHLTFTASGGLGMVGLDCTFAALVDGVPPALPANVRADESPDAGAGDVVVTMIRASGAGAFQEAGEGNPTGGTDDDAPGGPSVAASRDGYVEWCEGGETFTLSPGPPPGPGYGETPGDPATFAGVQGFMVSHYSWWTWAFVSNYAIVRSEEDRDANDDGDDTDGGEPSSNGVKEDLVYALDGKGKKKSYGPYRVARTPYGRVIGPPWSATLGPPAGPYTEVVMFVTTNGYVFVIQDSGASLAPYQTYPLRLRNNVTYADDVCDTAYSPLLFDGGNDFTGGTADDRFYICGALGATNRVYVTTCWGSGPPDLRARCASSYPVSYGGPPARSWPAVQTLTGTKYLHFATDYDAVAGRGRVFRIDIGNGAINQEYDDGGAGEPGSHVRGGLQLLDDPGIAGDAVLYAGCFEDVAAPVTTASFFAINTDSVIPGAYNNIWKNDLGTGDVDSYATFDDAIVYVGDSAGVFFRIDRASGSPNPAASTTLEAGVPIRSSPVIPVYGGGPVYVGNDNGKVFRVNRGTGAIERTYRLGDGRKVRSLSVVDEEIPDGPDPDSFPDGYITYVVAITHDGSAFLIRPP